MPGTILKQAPSAEPLLLSDVKAHIRFETDDEDSLIMAQIQGARAAVEAYLKRQLITQQWTVILDCFEPVIWIPLAPVQTVDAVRYVDDAGEIQTLASDWWQAPTRMEPARVMPAYSLTWPTARQVPEAVEIDVTVGYGASGDDVPAAIMDAIKLLVGDRHAFRENTVTGTIVSELPLGVRNTLLPYVFSG